MAISPTTIDAMQALQAATDVTRSASDVLAAPSSASAVNALTTAGSVVSGAVIDASSGTRRDLATLAGSKAAIVGLVLSAGSLLNSISEFNRLRDTRTSAENEAAVIDIAVKSLEVAAALAAAASLIPHLRILATAVWWGVVGAQQVFNGNGARLSDWLDQASGWLGLDNQTNRAWNTARTPTRRDPLAIDLDRDGIETLGIPAAGSPVLFDHNGDGIRTGTGWLRPNDAWLVRDLDGNGSIDAGRELFGVDTLVTLLQSTAAGPIQIARKAYTGFEAPRALKGSFDGMFNAQRS